MGNPYEDEGSFVEHTSCDKCGSKDNKAVYTDGHTYCFGCGDYRKSQSLSGRVQTHFPRGLSEVVLPSDARHVLPITSLSWLKQYGLTNEEIDDVGCCWSEQQSLLIFPQYNEGSLVGYIGRRFGGEGSKYVIRGAKTSFNRVYGTAVGNTTIIYTEDLVSAVKVSRVCAARPLFGTSLSRLEKGYDHHILWLDKDKQSSSVQQCRHWRQYGYDIHPVITDLDPKCYTTQQIEEYIK
jgi:hypothetical protein